MQEKRNVKNHLRQSKDLENIIRAKRENALGATKEERAIWRAHTTRVAKEKELDLKHMKKLLHKTYSLQAQRERLSAAANLESKYEQIAAI
jgi:UDP-N-acetylmuramyl pentapeptide synthase